MLRSSHSSIGEIGQVDSGEQSYCDRQNAQSYQDVTYDYMTRGIPALVRYLGLHYMRILKTYWDGITYQNLIRYRPQYKQMVENQYMWYNYMLKGDTFSVFKQIFESEKGPFLFVVIMSIVMGVISLFGAYYQRFLFFQHTEKGFNTSGWVFFAIIMVSALVRFFLFNYLQTTANQIAINIKIHLQNSYIRCLLKLPNENDVNEKSILYFNYFASIQVVYLALKNMPYFISSIVIVIGVIGFIVDIVGWLGMVLLGVTLFAFFVELILLYFMFHIHEQYAEASNRRNSISIFESQFLIRLIYNGLSTKFIQRILNYRRKQTNTNIKYTIADGFIQIFAECSAFFTVFIFYLYEETHGQPSYKLIFQSVILFSVFKTPVKMMAYGMALTMQLYGSTHALQQMFNQCKYREEIQQTKVFPRLYTHPTRFWQGQQRFMINKIKGNVVNLSKDHKLQRFGGQLLMILGKIDSNPSCDTYLREFTRSLPSDLKYSVIMYDAFMLDTSIRENILFGQQFNRDKFQQILKIVQLNETLQTFSDRQLAKIDENYFKTIFPSLSFKVQLARALYNNVDILIINRTIFRQFDTILNQIKAYRKQKNQITIVVNLSGSHYQIADNLLILNKNGIIQQGPYNTLIKTSQTLNAFENQFHKVQGPSLKYSGGPKHLTHGLTKNWVGQHEDMQGPYSNLLKFYNYNHYGAGLVLLILLCLPPLVDLYMEIIVAQSKDFYDHSEGHSTSDQIHVEQHKITYRFGLSVLVFFLSNLLKVFVLSTYLRNASYRIFKDVMKKFINTKIQTTLSIFNRKDELDLQRNIQSMDIRTTTQLDIGLTIVFENISIIVFASVSSLYFLILGLPFLVVIITIFVIMIKYSRKIFNFRKKSRGKMNSFVKKLINHREQVNSYHKNDTFFKKFVQFNKEDISYELNEDWLLEGLSIILEFIIILMLMTVLIVQLTDFHAIHQQSQAFLQLSISFLIGLLNGGRLDLKVFKSIDRQVLGISSLFRLIQHHDTHKVHVMKDLPRHQIQEIRFENFSVKFRDDNLTGLNVKISKGDRVVITGSKQSGKKVAINSLYRIFQAEHITGKVLIDQVNIYEQKISRQSLERLIHVIQNRTVTQFGAKVISYIEYVYQDQNEEKVRFILDKLWKIIDVEPLFGLDTKLIDLSAPCLDIFAVLLALLSKPQVLIIDEGLSHLDTMTRYKLVKWLVNQSEINIVIQLTNKMDVFSIYRRHLHFQQGRLIFDKVLKIPSKPTIIQSIDC